MTMIDAIVPSTEDNPQYTKGPWRLDDPVNSHLTHSGYHCIEAGMGYSAKGFRIAGFMSDADAYLIAAAPDLYEALRPLFEMADHYEVDDDHFVYFNAGKGITAGDIRRAKVIASKARGEQP